MTLADLDADLIGGFLQHLETERGNSVATRNARRAALRSFFTYASYRAPDAIATISRVLAIPATRTKTTLVSFLTAPEAEALIAEANELIAKANSEEAEITKLVEEKL